MNQEKKPQLNMVVALPCEARVLIDQYRLKKVDIKQLPIYQNLEKTISLVVSGVGKIKSAIATTFLHAYTNHRPQTCYLNIGIAGSKNHVIGESVMIDKIHDSARNKNWYPIPLSKTIPRNSLLSVDTPQTVYPLEGLVDMEGSGFFQAACQFVSQEQVQLFKIVSDNHYEQLTFIKPKMIEIFVKHNFSRIDEVVNLLFELSSRELEQTLFMSPELDKFLKTWHFTHYQQHQLYELLRRWHILCPEKEAFDQCQPLTSSKQVLLAITERLDQLEYTWE